jgi:selenide,water dikinase
MAVADTSPLDSLRLTEWTSCGGCAAKWGAALLKDLVAEFPSADDPSLLIGLAPFDDAAIYRISDDVALVSTTDFFPPLVDDPADFGAIAAANACSDVFAMGGRVVMAINVAAFPEHFPREAIATIFEAGAAVVAEAGGSVAGGHTIRNPEPIYGLAVQGVVHPDRIFRKAGARPGDALMLSKPLGTGLALAAGTPEQQASAIAGMRTLNRRASETLQALGDGVHAVTDVTGYGLAGHGWEMADRSGVRVVVDTSSLVTYPGALEAADAGKRTGGDPRNRDYLAGHLDSRAESGAEAICFDPQTSGGLLAAVEPALAAALAGEGWWQVGVAAAGDPQLVLE